LCFVVELDMISDEHTFSNIPEYGYGGTIERHILPFVRGRCGDDARQLNGITDTTLHIKPETIVYGDRYQPGFIPLPQVRVVP